MKTRKLRKFLMLLASALLLVSVTVGATVAYLTADDTVVNTFTVGNVALTLDELDVDNDNNTNDNKEYTDEEGVKTIRDKANKYHLLPGKTYTKDPIVHIDDESEEGWLFVEITNELADIETTIETQLDTNGWDLLSDNVYAYESPVEGGANIPVFATITITGDVDNTTLETYAGKNVTVKAYLVQKEGFADASTAWNATFGKSQGE